MEITTLNEQIAKAIVFAPPPTALSTELPTVTLAHAPGFLDVVKTEFGATAGDDRVCGETKAKVSEFLASIPAMDQFFKTICLLNMAVSADRDIADALVEPPAPLSPERTSVPAGFNTEPSTPAATPPPLPIQSTQCPLQVGAPAASSHHDPACAGNAPSKKRSTEDEKVATIDGWMALSRSRDAESGNKKVKQENAPEPMDQDGVNATD